MEGEFTILLDAPVDTGAGEQTRQNVKTSSKFTTALLVFTLCLAATATAVLTLNRHPKDPGQHEDSFDLHHALRQISNIRAAIHLEGEYNPHMNTSVEWKNQVDESFSQGGLELNNNEIVIPQKGLYFIYSQASFRVSCSSSDTDNISSKPMVHLSHTVKRWSRTFGNDDSKKSYKTILHTVRTACQQTDSNGPDQDGNWYSAVYMGAVFSLNRGDRLKTVMEQKMLPNLEDEPGKTFFGVFAL